MLRSLSHQLAGPSGRGVQQQLVAAAAAALACGQPGAAVAGSVAAFEAGEFACWQGKRWATKKQGGSTKNKADSNPKYLGAKMSDGQIAFPGQIIMRQRGLRFKAGEGVGVSVDHSLFAKAVGTIKFSRQVERMPGRPPRELRLVSVLPLQGDYSPEYREKAAAMVAARNAHRQRLLGLRAKFG
ncbi:MAG: ribosomal L27 protein-domain-containing protein [Monoraphidium minutum]|nr:MAG: ribosomal L27 protein-domain-containing protein [Monoraphidium minutum]